MLDAGARILPKQGKTEAVALFKYQQMQLGPAFPVQKGGRVVWVRHEPR